GQGTYGVICTTDVADATSPSNSHKLGAIGEMVGQPSDTVTLVFQTGQEVRVCLGVCDSFGNFLWERPYTISSGRNPGIDVCARARHVVWEQVDTSAGTEPDIYYRDLNLRMEPVNISRTWSWSQFPDVCGDDSGVAHIVWEEDIGGKPRIYYRTFRDNLLGDTFLVSTQVLHYNYRPSISIFDDGLTVIWQAYDTASRSPYIIKRRRCVGGIWQREEVLAQDFRPLHNVSLDYSHGSDVFGAAWEDSTVGPTLDPHFEGGNGTGTRQTPWVSTCPVLATCGATWSYLFWEEDDGGSEDILHQMYYFMSGWGGIESMRERWQIAEPIRAPSCLGALAVFTQGSGPEYKICYCFMGYPVGLAERPGQAPRNLTARSHPGRQVTISYVLGQESNVVISLADVQGRVQTLLRSGRQPAGRHEFTWHQQIPKGVYLLRIAAGTDYQAQKLVIP
ncbi:MAG: T9SS type A sorting domain-containing protein, partial [candidate division WOR-3 bacterium]